jgi:hypothetical protein
MEYLGLLKCFGGPENNAASKIRRESREDLQHETYSQCSVGSLRRSVVSRMAFSRICNRAVSGGFKGCLGQPGVEERRQWRHCRLEYCHELG